jgi:hypothetical protein
VVVVYQHADFTGWSAVFGEEAFDMDAFTGAGAVNDDASSVRVRGQDCKATFYQHAGFGGWAAGPFGEGDYDLGSLQEAGFVNDDMSSLKVFRQAALIIPEFGGDTCVVVVYQHADFTGWHAVFGEGDFPMSAF